MAEVSKEYKTISQIAGPLVYVKNTDPVGYKEMVNVRLSDGSIRRGQVLDTSDDIVVIQVFEGTTVTDTTETVVSFVPDKENARQTVFRFSRHFGLTSADDLSGAPFYAVTEDMQTPAEAPVIDEKLKKQKDDMIIGVNIPGKIKIRITDGTNTLGSFSTYAAQFGTVDTLSGSLFGKKFTSQIVLDKATGGITNLHTEPLD